MGLLNYKGYGIYKTMTGQYAILGEKPMPEGPFSSIKSAKRFVDRK